VVGTGPDGCGVGGDAVWLILVDDEDETVAEEGLEHALEAECAETKVRGAIIWTEGVYGTYNTKLGPLMLKR